MSVLKWHGGKAYLATKIRSLFKPHTRYVETHFGSGAVLFASTGECVSEYANDRYECLSNFWKVLASPRKFAELKRKLEATPLSEPLWMESFGTLALDVESPGSVNPVELAYAFFCRYRMSRQGLGKSFATPTRRSRRGMNENVSAWLTAIDGLQEAHARLRRVEIRCQDAVELIKELDDKNTLFYCDPPYLQVTRTARNAYAVEANAEDHRKLLNTLANIKGQFFLSGYPSLMYSKWQNYYRFKCTEFEIDNKASARKSKERKTECVWHK